MHRRPAPAARPAPLQAAAHFRTNPAAVAYEAFFTLAALVLSMAIAMALADKAKRKKMSISSQHAFGADGEIGNPIEIAAYKL